MSQSDAHRSRSQGGGRSAPSWSAPAITPRPPNHETTAEGQRAVLHGEEVARARAFFRIIFAISLITLAFIPVLDGVAWVRVAAAGLCIALAIISMVSLTVLRTPGRYTPAFASTVGVLCALIGVAVMYWVGLFSAGVMVLTVGIYFFGMSHSRQTARLVYATVGFGYLLLSSALAMGMIPDRALFSTEHVQPFAQWFQVVMSEVIFGLTFFLARSSRRATEGAVERVRQAALQITRREAWLVEARRDLAKATASVDGRHTGSVVGEFMVEQLIGRGAMGEVYRGTNREGRAVAIKMLHPSLVGSPTKVKRFIREATAASAVDSPHVPEVYGSGWTDDGSSPFLAMELLEGHDLSWHLRKSGRLELKLVVEMCQHVAAALAHVRDAGVVHRDLKPANLFLTDSLPRRWKVLDFGLSKLVWDSGSLTKDHAVGTPSYMSPEQVSGPSVDHLADLYALAAISYRCLTGVPPFSGNEIAHVLYRVMFQQPVCPGELAHVPVEVELVLAVGLAKNPQDRFANVEQFAEAMRMANEGKLDPEIQARGWALVKRLPWGSYSKRAGAPES